MANENKYPKSDWQYEVANGDTLLGYKEWLEHKAEAESTDRDVLASTGKFPA